MSPVGKAAAVEGEAKECTAGAVSEVCCKVVINTVGADGRIVGGPSVGSFEAIEGYGDTVGAMWRRHQQVELQEVDVAARHQCRWRIRDWKSVQMLASTQTEQ